MKTFVFALSLISIKLFATCNGYQVPSNLSEACWFLGQPGDSCDQVCGSQGLRYDPRTDSASSFEYNGNGWFPLNNLCKYLANHFTNAQGHDFLAYPEERNLGCAIGCDGVCESSCGPSLPDKSVAGRRRFCACQ